MIKLPVALVESKGHNLHLDGVKTNLYFTLLSTNNVYRPPIYTDKTERFFYRLSHKATSSILPLAPVIIGKSLKENLLKDGALASLGKSLMMAFILRCASFGKGQLLLLCLALWKP
jgi:hypothetical protein